MIFKSLGTNTIKKENTGKKQGYKAKLWATQLCSDWGEGASKKKHTHRWEKNSTVSLQKPRHRDSRKREFYGGFWEDVQWVRCGLSVHWFATPHHWWSRLEHFQVVEVDEGWQVMDCTPSSLFLTQPTLPGYNWEAGKSLHLRLYQNCLLPAFPTPTIITLSRVPSSALQPEWWC